MPTPDEQRGGHRFTPNVVIVAIAILAIVVFVCLWVSILYGCAPDGVTTVATATPAPTPNWTGEPVENWLRQASW